MKTKNKETVSKEILHFFDLEMYEYQGVNDLKYSRKVRKSVRKFNRQFVNGKDTVERYKQLNEVSNAFKYLVEKEIDSRTKLDKENKYDFMFLVDEMTWRHQSYLGSPQLTPRYREENNTFKVKESITDNAYLAGLKGSLITVIMHNVLDTTYYPIVRQWKLANKDRHRLAKTYRHLGITKHTVYVDENNCFRYWSGLSMFGQVFAVIFTILAFLCTYPVFAISYREFSVMSLVDTLAILDAPISLAFRRPRIGNFIDISMETPDALKAQKAKARKILKQRTKRAPIEKKRNVI